MTTHRNTIWDIAPHTVAKHYILRRYLQAWLPIMSSWRGRIVYIDGFAGPGKYSKGEDGSPIIALKAAKEHRIPIKTEVVFLFIEENKARHEYLEQLLQEMVLPPNFKYRCIHGKFDDKLIEALDILEEQKKRLAPAFVFIDPFGFSDTPFEVIKRIMENQSCEVLITFPYESINRFRGVETQADNFDRSFGTPSWRSALSLTNPDQRRQKIHDTYLKQLTKAAKIEYVRSFEMIDRGNRTEYFLFFGTNHYEGLRQMKQAMWRVDRTGQFRFSDATNNPNQPYLLAPEPDFDQLKHRIVEHFLGREEVDVQEIERFVVIQTEFCDTHFKTKILAPMERTGEIAVDAAPPRRRKCTYPNRTKIRFGG